MLYRVLLIFAVLLSNGVQGADSPSPSQSPTAAGSEPAAATVAASPTAAPVPGIGSGVVTADPFTVVIGLLATVLLIFLVAWLLRRMGSVSLAGGQAMKIVAALSVGTREKVLLVDVGGRQILLGVAPGRVSHLQSFEQPVISPAVAGNSEFATKIKQLLQPTDVDAANKS